MYKIIRAIRIYQWIKNILLFVPLILAHKVDDFSRVADATAAFLSFSLCASGAYVMNDLLDLKSDREHATKKNRPFASGDLSITFGVILSPVLFMLAAVVALFLPAHFFIAFIMYIVFTTIYSLGLKAIALMDVVILAGLYTLRIAAGAFAIDVPLSYWLLAFSMFLFFSLAMVKRYAELYNLSQRNEVSVLRRGYETGDMELVANLGAMSGYIAALVIALYINDPRTTAAYSQPVWLWIICPTILYWISRVWLLAHRGVIQEDPVLFAVRDKVSYFVAFVALGAILLAL